MEIMEVVQKHPVAVGAGVLVLVLLMMRGGTSNSSGTGNLAAASLQSQSIATQGNVQLAQINSANVQSANAATAQMYHDTVTAQSALSVNNTNAMVSAVMGYLGNQTNMAAIDAQQSVQNNQIAAGQKVSLQGLTNQYNMNQNDNATRLSLQQNQLAFNTAQLHSNENIAQINANAGYQVAQVNGSTAQNIASTQAYATNTSASTSSNLAYLGALMGVAKSTGLLDTISNYFNSGSSGATQVPDWSTGGYDASNYYYM